MAARPVTIPVTIGGHTWEHIAAELPDHIRDQFELRSAGKDGQTARAHVSPDDARLIRMAALRTERTLWASHPVGDKEVRRRRNSAQACVRLVLRIDADLSVEGFAP